MRILSIATYDKAGGAEKVAFDLHKAYQRHGHDAMLLVLYKRTDDASILESDPFMSTTPLAPLFKCLDHSIASLPRFRGQYRIRDWLRCMSWPQRFLDRLLGIEDFNYPYSHLLLNDPGWRPDVIHAHNLHGDFFDLNAITILSQRIPVVWTLHDTWAFTGHCGYFIDCKLWQTGCGCCPDLSRPPSIRRDSTAENLRRKHGIYESSRLAVATPSFWLMSCVEESILQPWRKKVIANGVDLSVFRPGNKQQARTALKLPHEAFICLFVAHSVGDKNPYKDFQTLDRAFKQVTSKADQLDPVLICIGAVHNNVSGSRYRLTGFLGDPVEISQYYMAADVLVHAANAENFPCTILEAMACGTPTIATAVGGIVEQIDHAETGFLVKRGDYQTMAQYILRLMNEPELCNRLGQAASTKARHSFGLEQQGGQYLKWFDALQAEYRRIA